MGLTRVLGVCLAVLVVSEAFVEFEKSRIYDETDFLHQRKVFLPNYCSSGCNIYVSIPDDSFDIARNIRIDTGSSTTSITDANSKEADGRKKPFPYKGAQVNFNNDNAHLESAPLLIWVVRQEAPHIHEVEIYDADDTYRTQAPAGLITIMNAEPFVVTTDTFGPMTVSAYTAGFDALEGIDECTRVLRQDNPATYQDVLVAVRSPLITFSFGKEQFVATQIALHASVDDVPSFDLAKPMFVTSPGYIGCSVKQGTATEGGVRTKTYRSSLYEDETKFYFESEEPVSVVMTSDLANEIDHTVWIDADGKYGFMWDLTNNYPEYDVTAKTLTIQWMINGADLNQYFMVRVEQKHELSKTTTTVSEEPERITTTEPVHHDITTTVESETVITTATESEPEPDHSTTDILEQEKTTTVGPVTEPEKTTTSDPEHTTTACPESENTTTAESDVSEPENTTTTESPSEPEQRTTSATEQMSTTAEPEPERTTTQADEPEKPTTTTRYTRRTTPLKVHTSTTTFHPKSTISSTSSSKSSTATTTTMLTTSGARYGSLLLSIFIASAVFFA